MGISVSGISFSYPKGPPVLSNISFEVENGHFVCLLGPNGVGKSTLFKCMLGLLRGYDGAIKIDGQDIVTLPPKQLSRRIAYIPQTSQYVFNYSVSDVVLMGTTALTDGLSSPGKRERALAEESLDRLGIAALRHRMFQQLSGGERQLALIARALAQQARILFMDEPTSNLDYGNQIRVLEQIRQLSGDGYTVVQSTHNPDQAFLFADEVLAIMDGTVCAYGPPNEVVTQELVEKLYNVSVSVESLFDDSIRICVPRDAIKTKVHI